MAEYQAGTAYVSVLPSLKGFQTRIRADVKGMFPDGLTIQVKPQFDAGTMRTQAQTAARGAGQTVKFKAELDRQSLSGSLIGVAALSRALRTIALPGAVLAATPALVSLAGSAASAAGSVLLLPAAFTAAGVGAGALLVGLSGVGEAFKQLSAADDAAVTGAAANAQARVAAAERIRSAEVSLAAAERAQSDVLEVTRRAQEELTQARKDAVRQLRDLQLSVEGAALSEEAAADRLDDARSRLAEARAGGAAAEDIDDLDRAVREADLSLREARNRYTDLKVEGAEWARTGIEGSEGVRVAHDRVSDAQRAQGDATRGVAEAQRQLATAVAAAAVATTAANENAALAMGKLSPAAQDLVNKVRSLGPAWTAVRLDVQERLLAGIGDRVVQLGGAYLPTLRRSLGGVADGFNQAAHATADWLLLPSTVNDVDASMGRVTLGVKNASGAMLPLTRAFWDLVSVGSEFLPAMGTGLTDMAERFRVFIFEARETGRLREWIQGAIDTLKTLGSIMGNVGSIIMSAFGAAGDSGESFLVTLDRITGRVAAALKTPEGAAGLTQFFTTVRDVTAVVVDKLVQLWPVVRSAGEAFAALVIAGSPLSDFLFDLVTLGLTPLLDLIGVLSPVLGPMAVTIGAIALATRLWAAAQWLLNLAMNANPIVKVITLLTGLVAGLVWAYQNSETFRNIVNGAWEVIQAVIGWAWNNVIKPIFDAFSWVIMNVIVPAVMWLWHNAIEPAFNAIGAVIQWVWGTLIKPTWDFLVGGLRLIGQVFQDTWNLVVRPVWNALGTGLRWVYDTVIQPAWNAMQAGLSTLRGWFDSIVNGIGSIWNRLRSAMARPINFMINTVWNQGIKPAWNLVAGLLPGIDPIGEIKPIPEMAVGGRVPGVGNGDTVPALLTPGEYVLSKPVVQKWGLDNIDTAHMAARSGRFPGLEGMFEGDHDGLLQVARYALGGAVDNAIRVAKSMHGKRYVWGGGSAAGTDCSGFMAFLTRALRLEGNPYRRIGTTSDFPWSGFSAGLMSAFGVGNIRGSHMRGNLAGVNVEAGGSHSTSSYGGPAAGVPYGQNFHLPEAGGAFVGGGPGGDSGFNPLPGMIRGFVEKFVDPAIRALRERFHGPPRFMDLPHKMAQAVRDKALAWFLSMVGGGTDAGTGPVQEQVRGVAQRFGWHVDPQWDAIYRLVQKESSWNPAAANPRSSARGLFQKMTSIHGPVERTAAGQAEWGLNYIRGRYGTPVAAWAHHQRNNWYDDGGVAYGTGMLDKRVIDPERVLSPSNTRSFDDLVRLIAAGRVDIGGDSPDTGGAGIENLYVTTPPGATPQAMFQEAFFQVRHAGKSVHR